MDNYKLSFGEKEWTFGLSYVGLSIISGENGTFR